MINDVASTRPGHADDARTLSGICSRLSPAVPLTATKSRTFPLVLATVMIEDQGGSRGAMILDIHMQGSWYSACSGAR
ncbi:hypothetical protein ACU4GD_14380 [Cupriavidus basilensis]